MTKERILLFFTGFCAFSYLGMQNGVAQSQQSEKPNSCISCHLEVGDEAAEPVKGMEHDVHAEEGLSCADCHGGDPAAGLDGDMDAAMDPAKGYIGAPERKDIPKFCARCHSDPNYMRKFNPRVSTDQFDRYKTSIHGQRLAKGDEKVATCTDCHGVHGIIAVTDPRASVYASNIPLTCGKCHGDPDYMRDYSLPTDQIDLYKKSVHGIALLEKGDQAAPACNGCHGNHGAVPPGLPSIGFVCGQCHLNNSELFRKSPHKVAFEENEFPECETCHGNHDVQHPQDSMLGTGENSMCADCHEEGSEGYRVAGILAAEIDTLKRNIIMADSLVGTASRAGMEVSEAAFTVNDARQSLVKARTTIHALSVDDLSVLTHEGNKLAMSAYEMGVAALDELQFRRRGLALSLVFILLLAIALYMKIKEVDRRTAFKEVHNE